MLQGQSRREKQQNAEERKSLEVLENVAPDERPEGSKQKVTKKHHKPEKCEIDASKWEKAEKGPSEAPRSQSLSPQNGAISMCICLHTKIPRCGRQGLAIVLPAGWPPGDASRGLKRSFRFLKRAESRQIAAMCRICRSMQRADMSRI